MKNDREMNFAAEETGRITFQATGGDAAGTHGIHNSGSITNDSVVALNVNIAAGSVAGAYGLMNEGRVTLKKGLSSGSRAARLAMLWRSITPRVRR